MKFKRGLKKILNLCMKSFKIFSLYSTVFFFINFNIVAQTKKIQSGVFFNYIDFLKNECNVFVLKGEGKFVKNTLNERIKIKSKDSTFSYLPGQLFGFYDGKYKYRYWKSSENALYSGYFKIKEVGQFIVYEKVIYHKSTKGSKLKGPVMHVFFSKEFNSAIKELNFNNLTEEFKNVPEILYFVNKIGAKCNSCLTKKTKNGYNITKQINKYNYQRADSMIKVKF